MALTNCLNPGDKVLIYRFGQFSHLWLEMAKRLGFSVESHEVEWGKGIPLDDLEQRLKADSGHEIKAVLATHNETSTGVTSDIGGVRKALDAANHPALLFVDGVSSIASIEFRHDDWGVDAAISGSQKGFMLPAGAAILAFSQKALAAAAVSTYPRAFLSLQDQINTNKDGYTPYTPSTPMLYGLRKSLELLLAEGIDNVYAREVISIAFNKYNISLGAGLSEVSGKVFRIGHIGDMNDVSLLGALAGVEMAMLDSGIAITAGSGVAAALEYYRATA